MGFRTVVIKNRCKLDLRLNYLVCRGEEEIKVFIPEINTLVLESTAISVTTALISELTKNNVKIIVCDEKHNPQSELVAYYGSCNNSGNIKRQISWNETVKGMVWRDIVRQKINKQMSLLEELNFAEESNLLGLYAKEVTFNDQTNREGHAAKVYFNALFGKGFGRRAKNDVNSALNYGYSLLLACFNREIVSMGYLTQLGIWHKNEFNSFNFASDLMEPYRPVIDRVVINMQDNDNFKSQLLQIFNMQLRIDGKKQYLENAIGIYCSSVVDALNSEDTQLIKHYEL